MWVRPIIFLFITFTTWNCKNKYVIIVVDLLIGHYTYSMFPPDIDVIPTSLAVTLLYQKFLPGFQYGPVTMIVLASGHQFAAYPGCRWAHLRDRLFMWIKILCIEYVLWGIPTIESTFDVANMVKIAIVKDVPINNDTLLNIQAC